MERSTEIYIYKFIEAIVCVAIVCSFMLTSCGKNENSIAYGDVVFTYYDHEKSLGGISEAYTKMDQTYSDAMDSIEELGIPESASSAYGESYFTSNDLLVIAFLTSAAFNYTVDDLTLEKGVLTVHLNEIVPKVTGKTGKPAVYSLVASCQAILIDIPKGSVPEDVDITIQSIRIEK